MWHCHILSHEEMEMMRPISFDVATTVPAAPVLAVKGAPGVLGAPINLTWIDGTPASDPATWGNPKAEIGFRIERSTVTTTGTELAPYSTIATELANVTNFHDTSTATDTVYRYRVTAYNASGEAVSVPTTAAAPSASTSYTISPWASSKGSITPSSKEVVAAGGSSAFAILPNANCQIVDVLVDGVSIGVTDTVTLTNVQNDHAVWAVFGPRLVPVTVNAGANGSITPSGTPAAIAGQGVGFVAVLSRRTAAETTHDVPYGTSETFNIMPQLGYHIEDVLVNDVSVGAVYSYTFEDVTVPHTISAVFARNTYTIATVAGGGGAISPNTPTDVAYGDDKTFTITPSAHFHVADVLVNGESVGALTSWQFTNVTSDETITATFAASAPDATSISRPSVSPSRPTHGKTATFTSLLTPSAAVASGGTSQISFYRYETKTVRKKVRGRWKNVRVHYWHLRTTKTMSAGSDGHLTLKYRLPYSGSWKVVARYTGSATHAASTSSARQFTAK
jgi:hypothetical protein